MPASALPVSVRAARPNRTIPSAIIGTITMSVKNSRRRPRKLMLHVPQHTGYRCNSVSWAAAAPLPWTRDGAIAQLGERLDRTQEAAGSSPASSTAAGEGTHFWLGAPLARLQLR